jgi:glycosyltransferase involved in cell wall biosynthesis
MDGTGVTDGLVILVPVLRRPHRVRPLLRSIRRTTPRPYRVLFIADPGDEAEQDAVRDAGGELLIVAGNYARKINAGIDASCERLILTGADDVQFHRGWLEAAVAHLRGTVMVVGTNDLCNPLTMRGEHATHFLVDRRYVKQGTIDEPGKLMHEGYPHEYVDNELVATAKARGVWAWAQDSIVEHLHPNVGKAPIDDLYAASRQRMRAGRAIFNSRRHLWA